ncbi:proline iminopeptidase, partial [Bacillus cereus]
MNQLMLQDGVHYLKINGVLHWCKVAGAAHN